jgi:lysophospholipase L1-like esterase
MGARPSIAAAGLLAAAALAVAAWPADGHRPAAPARPAAATSAHWVQAWAAAPQAASGVPARTGFSGVTLREIVVASIGGRAVRVRLSNAFGTRTVRVAAATIGQAGRGAAERAGSVRELRFSGRPGVALARGGVALSDPLRVGVRAREALAVTLYIPGSTGAPTLHAVSVQTNYRAAGEHLQAGAAGFTGTVSPWYFLDGVSVLAPRSVAGAVVVLGDSISDGFRTTPNANDRWPDDLSRRLVARRGGARLSVIDAGISGNRVLSPTRCYGVDAIDRFPADVLGQAGVRAVILLEGTNDIGMSQDLDPCSPPGRRVTAAALIAGYRRIIAEAHSAGLRIYGATLPPFAGSGYGTLAAERTREAVNRWIRTGGAFDGVIDADRALADPADPERLAPWFDSGDHLHPNDAGAAAIAGAVSLRMLLRGTG